jgi:hypothetical protein
MVFHIAAGHCILAFKMAWKKLERAGGIMWFSIDGRESISTARVVA